MILITDSNLLISALITPKGVTASIIKAKHNFQFIAPDFIFEEINDHWDKIKILSSLNEKELKKELDFYKSIIGIFDEKVTKNSLDKAEKSLEMLTPKMYSSSPCTYTQGIKFGREMKP